MPTVVYDAGALIAAEHNDRRLWAKHRARLEAGLVPLVSSTVVAQVSRSERQVQLRRLLAGCTIIPFREDDAHAAGVLLARANTSDVVDAAVVTLALAHHAEVIVTSDPSDLRALLDVARTKSNVQVTDA